MELSCVDIHTEVSMLASQMALPHEGHLDMIFRVFTYRKTKHSSRLVLNPSYPELYYNVFPDHDWSSMYGDVKEAIPPDAPTAHGIEVDICLFVDSDHASDKLTYQSHTGFFIFLNSTLILRKSKKQPMTETFIFVAEIVAMKHGIEMLCGLCYKLQMMGVPLSSPSYIYGDNMSVIHNMQ